MPLYEYQCTACQRRTEKIQKFSDAELTVCPHCGGTLERTLTAPNVQFKGGGWYKDLYSSAKPAAAGASGDASGSGAGATASGTSDSGGSSAATSASDGGKAAETAKPSSSPASTAAAPATTSSTPATKA